MYCDDEVEADHAALESEERLLAYLDRADIYVTPYSSREQSSSGTLAYAAGRGKAIISTAYSYARELLGDDSGMLVEQGDVGQLRRALATLLATPALRRELGQRVRARALGMGWPSVASMYRAVIVARLRLPGTVASIVA